MAGGLGVGVIGLGMGRSHVRNFQKIPETTVLAVADLDRERLANARAEYGIPDTCEDYRALLDRDDIDIIVVATPNSLHRTMALDALAAGKHVLCEKPMAMNAQEGAEMRDAAVRSGKKFMLHFNRRFRPASRAVRGMIDEGRIGPIYYARTGWTRSMGIPRGNNSWFVSRKLAGGGALIDLGVHMLDLAMWFLDYPAPLSATGSTYNKLGKRQGIDIEVDELATAFIRLENGATLLLEASWAGHTPDSEHLYTQIMGTDGGALLEARGYRNDDVHCYNAFGSTNFNWNVAPAEAETPQEHFARCILENRPPECDAEQGLKIMRILDAVYESAATGTEVRIGQ